MKVFGFDLIFFFGLYALVVFLVVGLPIFLYMEFG